MVTCLERSADLHIAQLMPLPLTVSCFSKIEIGFAFLVPAHLGSPGKRAIKRVCVCVYSSSDSVTQLTATNSVNSFANIYSSTDGTACASKQQVVTEMTGKGRIAPAIDQINWPYAGHFIYFTMGRGCS